MGYSRKNPHQPQEPGVEDMEFPGVLKKEHVEIQGSIKKEVEFPRQECSRKTHVEFPLVLVCDLGISKWCQTILQDFQQG